MSKSSLSRRAQACADCDQSFSNLNNLKVHFERCHPGKKCRPKGQTMLNFSNPLKRSYDGDPTHYDKETESSPPPAEDSTQETQQVSKTMSSSSSSFHIKETDISLMERMQSVIDQFKNKEMNSTSIDNKTVNEEELLTGNDNNQCQIIINETEIRIKVCASLKDIEVVLASDFSVDKVNEVVRCITCITDFTVNQNTPGIFKTHNVEYEKENVQSRQLRHLKEHMIAHLKSACHQVNADKQTQDARSKTKSAALNLEFGRKIGSLAYFFF